MLLGIDYGLVIKCWVELEYEMNLFEVVVLMFVMVVDWYMGEVVVCKVFCILVDNQKEVFNLKVFFDDFLVLLECI